MTRQYNQPYNIYFGTIGKKLGLRYRYTKYFKSDEEAKLYAREAATSYYYKNEGKHGLPSFADISKESNITGVDLEILYKEHIHDLCRYYAIPTSVDTILSKDLRF